MTNKVPTKAVSTAPTWKWVSFSFRKRKEKTRTKKGDILLSMEALESTR